MNTLLREMATFVADEVDALVFRSDGAPYFDKDDSPLFELDEWPVFISYTPPKHNKAVVLRRFGGSTRVANLPLDDVSFQIAIRGPNEADEVEELAEIVWAALQGQSRITLPSGRRIVAINGQNGGPINAGFDKQQRIVYTLNFELQVRDPRRS